MSAISMSARISTDRQAPRDKSKAARGTGMRQAANTATLPAASRVDDVYARLLQAVNSGHFRPHDRIFETEIASNEIVLSSR